MWWFTNRWKRSLRAEGSGGFVEGTRGLFGWLVCLLLLGGCLGVVRPAMAQLQVSLTPYGRNQKQVVPVAWKWVPAGDHRVYYAEGLDSNARWLASLLPEVGRFLEQQWNIKPEQPYQVLMYPNPAQWTESNLEREKFYYNKGWNFPAPGNKVPVYAGVGQAEAVSRLREGVVRILLTEILYGGRSWQRIQNQAILVLPDWFTEGLARYWGYGWTPEMELRLRSWMLSRNKPRFGELVREEPILAGAFFWKSYTEDFGRVGVTRLVQWSKSQRQVTGAFRMLHQMSYSDYVNKELRMYQDLLQSDSVQGYLSRDALRLEGVSWLPLGPARMDAKGKMLAFGTYAGGRYRLIAYDRTAKKASVLFRSPRIQRPHEEALPLLAWHPGGMRLAMMAHFGEGYRLHYFVRDAQGAWQSEAQSWPVQDWVQSLDWSADGKYLSAAARQKGLSQLLLWKAGTWKPYTLWTDGFQLSDARFTPDGQSVLAAATQPWTRQGACFVPEQGWQGESRLMRWDLRTSAKSDPKVDTGGPTVLQQSGEEVLSCPLPMPGGWMLWLSAKGGLIRRQLGKWNTTDRQAGRLVPWQSLATWHEGTPQAMQLLLGRSYGGSRVSSVFRNKLDTLRFTTEAGLEDTLLGREESDPIPADSVQASWQVPVNLGMMNPKGPLNASYPPWVVNRRHPALSTEDLENSLPLAAELQARFRRQAKAVPANLRVSPYVRAAAIDNVSFQAGNNILQGRMPLLSTSQLHLLHSRPGAVTRISLSDLPEDHNLTAGALVLQSITHFQAYLMYENLGKLLDWRLMGVYSRLSAGQAGSALSSGSASSEGLQTTGEIYASVTYPWSQTVGLSASLGYSLSAERQPVNPDFVKGSTLPQNHLLGFRLEWMVDRTRRPGGVLGGGYRLKIFEESYLASGTRTGSAQTVGFDGRLYHRLFPGLVGAYRLSYQQSLGPVQAVYMVGGAEQWLLAKTNQDMPVPSSDRILMLAMAAPVRGLPLNSRNGSAFFGLNAEWRLMPVAFRSALPVGSDFWRNFQVMSFFDAGTAWNKGGFLKTDPGLFPTQINQGPVQVLFNREAQAVLWSYGLGVRSQVLGYSVRLDRAWPVENKVALPPTWVISLGLDF